MANREYEEFPLTFEKGLVSEIEESVLDVGQASELINWEPATYGGLRVRNAYTSMSTDGLTAPYRVRGFGSIATGTAVAGAVNAPVQVQHSSWPNGDADPVASKTLTLNGVNIGNVLIAYIADDSGLTPTVTGGWTQRAVSSGDKQYVKFYTKVAASSTEAFTYTIATARIRAMSVFEVKYLPGEDPGTAWAATSQFGGSGTDSVTVTNADSDGAFTLVGYLYDGGTPDTADSGTSGWGTPTQVNANTRTGVTFEDLDQLDGANHLGTSTSISYVSPSWTPPATGLVIVLVRGYSNAGANFSTMSVTGNGLTWNDAYDASELGEDQTADGNGVHLYAWADCSLVSPTAGAITVTIGGSLTIEGIQCSFVRAIGADTTDPFVQFDSHADSTAGTEVSGPTLGSALQPGSGLLGIASHADTDGGGDDPIATPTIGTGNWEAVLDSFSLDLDPNNTNSFNDNAVGHMRTAYSSSSNSPDTQATWSNTVTADNACMTTYEIRGQGNAAKVYRGTVSLPGTMIEEFSYISGKRIVAKMVSWGYTPPSVTADTVDFYIVMALAQGSTTYKVYRIGRDDITSGTWEQIDVVTDALDNSSLVSFAQGAGHLIWTASSMNYPRAIELATLSAFNITDMLGLAGRTVAYHKDRLFMAGSSQNPSRLYFSGIGTPTDFVTATDFIDIGGDDGEAIQDLSSVEGLLLVPKTNRAYLISGSGVESFFVNELAGGTAAVGRSAVRTPYGTILAGDDDVWVVQGGGVDPMSRPLGGGYDVQGAVSTAYAQDMALIADTGNSGRVWRVNLVTGAWSEETTSNSSLEEAVYLTFSLNGRLYYGTNDSDTEVGGTRRLTSDRNFDQTTGAIDFHAATGRMAMFGPQVRYTPRHLYLQLRSQDPTKPNELFLTVETNLGSQNFSYRVSETTQREYRSIGFKKGVEWIKFYLSCDSSPEHAAIDVEKAVLTCATEDY